MQAQISDRRCGVATLLVRGLRYGAVAVLLAGWVVFSVGIAAAADPTLAVQSVSFNDLGVVNDMVGGPNPFLLVAKPQWSAGTQTGPVAYVSGTQVTVTVTFAITNPPTAATKVFVTGSNATVGDQTMEGTLLPRSPTLTVTGFTFPNAFAASQTQFFNSNFQIAWTYRYLQNGGPTFPAGTSTHTLYVTLAPANPAGTKIYRTSLKLAIPVGGDKTADAVFATTWGSFTAGGTGPANVTNWQSKPLYYYRPPPPRAEVSTQSCVRPTDSLGSPTEVAIANPGLNSFLLLWRSTVLSHRVFTWMQCSVSALWCRTGTPLLPILPIAKIPRACPRLRSPQTTEKWSPVPRTRKRSIVTT